MIDKLYALNDKRGTKPHTYRKTMDTAFLDYSKKKNKSKKTQRKMNRKLLESLIRNIKYINALWNVFEKKNTPFPLNHQEQRMFWIIQTVYAQQKQMYDSKSSSCKDRIVRIFQLHVRPIPRGKANARIGHLNWDA